jgi:hypothetical protein
VIELGRAVAFPRHDVRRHDEPSFMMDVLTLLTSHFLEITIPLNSFWCEIYVVAMCMYGCRNNPIKLIKTVPLNSAVFAIDSNITREK